MQNGSFDFANARAAMVSPLAKKLFLVDGVTGGCVRLVGGDDAAAGGQRFRGLQAKGFFSRRGVQTLAVDTGLSVAIGPA